MGYASTARWKTFRDPSVPALGTHPHDQRSRLFLEDLVYMVVLVFMFGCNYVWTVQKDRIEHKCHHYFRFIWLGCFNVWENRQSWYFYKIMLMSWFHKAKESLKQSLKIDYAAVWHLWNELEAWENLRLFISFFGLLTFSLVHLSPYVTGAHVFFLFHHV